MNSVVLKLWDLKIIDDILGMDQRKWLANF